MSDYPRHHDTREIEAALDALARVDGAAPRGCAQRIADASLPAFRSTPGTTPVVPRPLRMPLARLALAAAAMIALVAAATVWFGAPTPPPPAPQAAATPETLDIVDAWLDDSPFAGVESQLDDLFFAIAEFNPRSAPDWTVDDLLTLEGDAL
jgi:hypothetical protein